MNIFLRCSITSYSHLFTIQAYIFLMIPNERYRIKTLATIIFGSPINRVDLNVLKFFFALSMCLNVYVNIIEETSRIRCY